MLGPIVTAYEQAMTEGEGKNTWRTDRYSPCPRREAGTYLAFLASIGHQLSPIELALVNDTPYTGDTPPALPVSGDPDPEDADGDLVPGSDDPAADSRRLTVRQRRAERRVGIALRYPPEGPPVMFCWRPFSLG